MKQLVLLISILFLVGCSEQKENIATEKYIVETKVQLLPGKSKVALELFQSTNPDLVSGESDWLSASFSSIENENIVIVRAEWKSKESYLSYARTEKFQSTMRKFSQYFAGKPETSISKVLFEM